MRSIAIVLLLALDGGSTWQPCDGSGLCDLYVPAKFVGTDPGDRDVRGVILRADGGWATDVNPDGGLYWYRVPIAAPPSRLMNLADAGWVSETPLPDGGVLRVPASTPPGY